MLPSSNGLSESHKENCISTGSATPQQWLHNQLWPDSPGPSHHFCSLFHPFIQSLYTVRPHPSSHSPPTHCITLFGIIFAQRYEPHFCIFKPSLIHSCFLALFAQVPAPPTGSEAPGNMPTLGSACPTAINHSTPGPKEWTQGCTGSLLGGRGHGP